MKSYKFPLGINLDYRSASKLEALIRARLDVKAVSCAHGNIVLWTDKDSSYAKIALELSKLLGNKLITKTKAVTVQAKELAKVKSSNISKELQEHKRSALMSLGFFVFFEILKRANPTAFAASVYLRSLCVLFMSENLIREGILEAFKEKRPNADTLTMTAVLSSVIAKRPESSFTVLALSNFSEMLTTLAAQKARQNISSLVALDVQEVWIKNEDGVDVKVPIEQVKPGMQISIHTGEKICVDGRVISGKAAVDQAAITGESIPVEKNINDRVFAGSNIRLGDLVISVEKVGDDTSLARIVHMIEDAQNRRAPIQNYADKMSTALVPISFISAAIVYLFTKDWQRVLNMLFIDFSCGLKLSTATAMSASISRAAKSGILVKGGSYIEKASEIDTIVLDKTGTITTGKPSITKIKLTSNLDEDTVLKLAAGAEMHSSHPLAVSILDELKKRKLLMPNNLKSKTIIARGIEATLAPFDDLDGGEVLVGSKIMMLEHEVLGLDSFDFKGTFESSSLIYVAYQGYLVAILEICDQIRPEFKRAINRLRYSGIEEIVMLTGDNKRAAKSISEQLALDDFKAEVLPEEKASYVAHKQANGNVLMIGDGINDAPALAYSDIGVAMGSGCTDTAMETADVTINSEDPLKIPEFINISKTTMRLVHQNFAATIALNSAAMMLGALGVINPLMSSVIHNATTLGVVLNSARVLLQKKKTAI